MLVLLLLLACSDPSPKASDTAAPEVDPLSWSVDAAGPFAVGHREWDVSYEPMPGEARTFRVHAWYPTDATTGEPVRYDGFVDGDPAVLGESPLAPTAHADGHPVLAYSHGDQGWGATSEFLMIHAASHGWVAVAPSHTGNLLWANTDPVGHWYHRPLDIRAAVDALPAELPGVDTSRFVISGHSRGVTTVWTVAGASFDGDVSGWCDGCTPDQQALFTDLADPRAVGGIGLAGSIRRSMFGDEGHASVGVPFLSLAGSADPVGQEEQFNTTAGVDLTWVELEGGCHQTFALGTCSTLPTDDGWSITATYAFAFARHHLLGDASVVPILDGSEVVDSRAALKHHN
ncbi:MAG: putative dienelactone hydrolase [Myxococcota bacterium]